jgi:two-component system sensor kinase FixL
MSDEDMWEWPSVSNSRVKKLGSIYSTDILEDMAERKLAELSQHESDERFRLLADTAPVMIWMSNTDMGCTYVNRLWQSFTGRTLEQELGEGWTEDIHEEDLQRCLAAYNRAFDAREPLSIEYRMRCQDGGYRWVQCNGVPRFSAAQGFVGYLKSCVDINERKQRDEVLIREKAFLRQVIDITPTLLFAKDREGRFTLANKAVADIYGTTVDALIGKTDADFNPNKEEVELFRQMDLVVMDSLQERFIAEEPITDAAGRLHWLQTVKRPILEKDGTAKQVLGASTDITARKQAELEQVRQHNEMAHLARVAMMGEMTASLAHELNQPLTAILSNVQTAQRMLDDLAPDLAEIREILSDVVSDNQRASEIIRRLRGLLKKSPPKYQMLNLNDVILEVMRLVRGDALIRHVTVELQLAPHLPAVRGDRIQLQQILLNLWINAIDAMQNDSVSERRLIIATTGMDADEVRVTVTDTGTGIPPDQLEKVFDRFITSKPQGLGMGLAIARSIIQMHGGHIWATNNADRGVTFQFVLPINEEPNS